MESRWLNGILLLITLKLCCRPANGELQDNAAVNDTKGMDILDRVIKSSNPFLRPYVYGPPVVVHCDFFIQSLGPINEIDMDFSMEIYFRQQWVDKRLTFTDETPLHIPVQKMDRIWVPDVYFPNEKEAKEHAVTTKNRAITIYPNGTLVQSTRITLRLECNMLLMSFPLDYQKCDIKISSYAFEDSQLRLIWYGDNPIQTPNELSLQQFELLNTTIGNCTLDYKSGNFSCLMATFHLKRQIGFYVLQTYIPSILIVMLSWVSFWINKDAVPARISLGVTTVLTMTTQLSTSRSNSMRVSYPKAIDVWYASCMLFVFGALLEYALINVLSRSGESRRRGMGKSTRKGKSLKSDRINSESHLTGNDIEMQCPAKTDYDTVDGQEVHITQSERMTPREFYLRFKRYFETINAKGVDHASRSIFPGAFAVFNFIYWTVYTRPHLFLRH